MNENAIERPVTRRRLLAVGLAGGVSLIVGCGSATESDAGWTFVDDRKHTVRLVFGDYPQEDPALAGFPWNNVDIVGSVYGEIDAGTLRSLMAELIVSRWYPPPRDAPVFGFRDRRQQNAIASQVPIVGINGHAIATRQIDRFRGLARALGASTTSDRDGQARAAFVRAAVKLSQVASRKSDLRIIAASGDQSTMYVAKIVDDGDLAFYAQRGVPLVSAATPAAYWDRFPWRHAAKYPADGILYDARSIFLPLRQAMKIPQFTELPAVQANQIGRWQVDPPPPTRRTHGR
jgi:iron complex transport system substrate-binding protein